MEFFEVTQSPAFTFNPTKFIYPPHTHFPFSHFPLQKFRKYSITKIFSFPAVHGSGAGPKCCDQFTRKNCTSECDTLTCYRIHHDIMCTDQCQDLCVCPPYLYLDRCSGKCVYHTNCPSKEQTEKCQNKTVNFCPR